MLRAGGDESGASEKAAAMESLCRAYWHPLYFYLRRQGLSQEEAEDVTQDLFAHLMSRPVLAKAEPEKGRFRSYLLGVLKNVLAHARSRESAGKRGGGAHIVALDSMEAEARYRLEPVDAESPDVLYDRRWAATVMSLARQRLRAEYEQGGGKERFDVLKEFLITGVQNTSYAEAAAALGLSESALKSAIFKLRQRFSAALRAEIAETVASETEVEEELRHLAKVLGA